MNLNKFKINLNKYGIVFILFGFAVMALVGIFYNFSVINTIGDETVLMAATLKMIAEMSLRADFPTNYHMPVGTYMYMPFFIVFLLFLRLSGLFSSFAEIKEFGIIEYAKFLPVARFVSVILGVLSIYLVYKICQKLFKNTFISLTAAFLLATNAMFLLLAHFGKVWMPQIFAILLAVYCIVGLYYKYNTSLKDYLKQALLIGISFGTHFIGILVYIPFLVVHYFKNKNKTFYKIFIANKSLWVTNLAIILLLFIVFYLNPYGFINYSKWSSSTTSHILDAGSENARFNLWRGVSAYAVFLFEYGYVLTVIFLASLIPLFRHRRDLFFILFSFIVGYYLVIGPFIASSTREVSVYIGPMIPFMAIISAYGIHRFYQVDFIAKKIRVSIILLIMISSLYMPVMLDYALLRPSAPVAASDWIQNIIPSGTKIVNIGLLLPINESKESIENTKKHNPGFLTKKQNHLLSTDEGSYPKPNYYVFAPGLYQKGIPEEISDIDFDYVVISWYTGGYAEVFKEAESYGVKKEDLIQIFPSHATPDSFGSTIESIRRPFFNLRKITYNGPAIAIYKISK